MNNERIRKYVDEIFKDVLQTGAVKEQKEELTINLSEKLSEYMKNGQSLDEAFNSVVAEMGDTHELTLGLERATKIIDAPVTVVTGAEHKSSWFRNFDGYKLTALAPFIYIMLGYLFDGWALCWVIIPLTAIWSAPTHRNYKWIASSPFIYYIIGMLFDGWTLGWIIIPVSAILLGWRRK